MAIHGTSKLSLAVGREFGQMGWRVRGLWLLSRWPPCMACTPKASGPGSVTLVSWVRWHLSQAEWGLLLRWLSFDEIVQWP